MCYSAAASGISIGIELLVAIVLFFGYDWACCKNYQQYTSKDDNRVIATVILGIGSMQYAELLMHLDDQCDNGNNATGSKLAILSLVAIQPAFGYIAITEFGYRSKSSAGRAIKIAWIVAFFTYMILISTNALNDMCGTHTSANLGGNVSNLCTVDHSCDGPLCDLTWHFDDVNQRPRYWFYLLTTMLLPAAVLEGWELWVALILIHSLWSLFANPHEPNDIISGASVTCYWLPMLAGLLQLVGAPIWIHQALMQYCNKPTDKTREKREEEELEPLNPGIREWRRRLT